MRLRSVFLLIAIAGSWSGLIEARAPAKPLGYVVFYGEIAVVDLERGRVIKRLDFIHHLRPATRAELIEGGKALRICGNATQGGYGAIRVSVPDLTIGQFEVLQSDPLFWSDAPGSAPDRPFEVVARRISRGKGAGAHLLLRVRDRPTGRLLAGAEVPIASRNNPYERFDSWAATPDARQLLVITHGGFNFQSHLRIFELPSMRLSATVPLLKIFDDVPIKLFVL